MILDQIERGALWLAVVVAGLGALGWLARKVWKLFKKFDTILRVVQWIEKEMRPNGGSSLRDAVDDVRSEVGAVRKELAEHKDEHARQSVQVNVGGPVPLPTQQHPNP